MFLLDIEYQRHQKCISLSLIKLGNWYPNPNLKAEQALNQSINIQAEHRVGLFGMNIYHSRYKDFLIEQETEDLVANTDYNEYSAYYGAQPFEYQLGQQMVNIDRASISGIELNSKMNLDQVFSVIPEGWKLLANLGYSKARLKGSENSLLSIQPLKVYC